MSQQKRVVDLAVGEVIKVSTATVTAVHRRPEAGRCDVSVRYATGEEDTLYFMPEDVVSVTTA